MSTHPAPARRVGAAAAVSLAAGAAAALAAPAAGAATCPTGSTTVSATTCEVRFATVGSTTWTPPAGVSALEALLVGSGGAGVSTTGFGGYGGGGGAVRLVQLSDHATAIAVQVGESGAASGGDASRIVQGATVATAAAGLAPDPDSSNFGGTSGNGNLGADSGITGTGPGGGGAGASPTGGDGRNGGAGLVVSAIAGPGSLFADDDTCYGGGGTGALYGPPAYTGVATCGGGAAAYAGSTWSLVATRANSGGGGSALDSLWGVVPGSQPGADGIVVIRFALKAPKPKPRKPARVTWSGWTPYSRVVVRPNARLTATFSGQAGVAYAISAMRRGGGSASGTCSVKAGSATCVIRMARAGRWVMTITPTRGGVDGPSARRVVLVRAASTPVTG